ncbi:MAG: histidine phosphatase family protein [Opitutales bacterium]|nr:histidine phosphatase family protein [Opitutales bacterium]MCH8540936.1 histidine phosphatase family protein [Opitutales bacterium]
MKKQIRVFLLLICLVLWSGNEYLLSGENFPLFTEWPEAAFEPLGKEEWRQLLEQEGPWLVISRHGKTAGQAFTEMPKEELEERRGERTLSEVGWREAQAAGEFLTGDEISFTGVYASPLYRARDTARLVFGDFETWEPLRSGDAGLPGEEELYARLETIFEEERREVWVTHSPNVADLLGVAAQEGQMFLLRWENGKIVLAATWRIDLASE